ncbi:hypothetical protein [Pseudomonas sp. R37(2017)]|uniref:hypothetical protein n=1 Tax=Pseudomonas sp. R37(2017) TaxID=1981685 RepID=UPI000A1F6E71|nr:hypothetical protein [Pseudomonas sp. R37(2017)]
MNKSMNRLVLAGMLCGFYPGFSQAATLNVDAEIKPDPSNPASAEIINKTPVTGFCVEYPGQCASNRIRSNTFNISFQSSGAIPQDGSMPFNFPATWRRFKVDHESIPGETAEIEIRISGAGTRYRLSDTAQALTGRPSGVTPHEYHVTLWRPSWANAVAPCTSVISDGADPNGRDYTTFWRMSAEVTSCGPRTARFAIPWMTLDRLDVDYELRAVRPEKLISGNYSGSYTYTIPNDLNMGNLTASDPSMTFNLNLSVKQDVKVVMSSDRVALAPKGGWMEWIANGRKEEKLLGDLRFSILSSAPFKMELTCERFVGDTCAISNGSHQVPVDMSVSLAPPWVDDMSQPVSRRPLTVTGAGLQHLKLIGSATGQPSILHFEVQADSVKDMQGDSSYRGTVYVTFDSDI